MAITRSAVSRLSVGVAGLLFASALIFPSVGTCIGSPGETPHWFDSTDLLLAGWLAILFGQIGWFANVGFVLNAAALIRGEVPRPIAVASQIVCLAAATISLQPSRGMMVSHFEGPTETVCALGSGFWIWVGAQAVMIAGALTARWHLMAPLRADDI